MHKLIPSQPRPEALRALERATAELAASTAELRAAVVSLHAASDGVTGWPVPSTRTSEVAA